MFFGGDNLGQDDDSEDELLPRSLDTSVSVLHGWKSSGPDSASPGQRERESERAWTALWGPLSWALQWFPLSGVDALPSLVLQPGFRASTLPCPILHKIDPRWGKFM